MRTIAVVIFFLVSKTVSAQNPMIVKLSDKNLLVRIYKNCNCGGEILNESAKIVFSKTKGEKQDTLHVRLSGSNDTQLYLIEKNIKKTVVKSLEIKRNGKSLISRKTLWYYDALLFKNFPQWFYEYL